MSVKLNYGSQSGSEIIESLPLSQEPLLPTDYAKIAPLLDEGSKLVQPLKRYIIAILLFFICSLSVLDELIRRFSPAIGQFSYVLLLVKAVIFGVVLYVCDQFISG
jgi:hypothetical protein